MIAYSILDARALFALTGPLALWAVAQGILQRITSVGFHGHDGWQFIIRFRKL